MQCLSTHKALAFILTVTLISNLVAAQLQLNVVRYAMIDMLKRPPPGFEDVVTAHFRIMRHSCVPCCLHLCVQR